MQIRLDFKQIFLKKSRFVALVDFDNIHYDNHVSGSVRKWENIYVGVISKSEPFTTVLDKGISKLYRLPNNIVMGRILGFWET